MKISNRRPGVILLPVSAVFIIFLVLLFLLVDQRRSNNALILEYNASRTINLILDLYLTEQEIDPAEIDSNIMGFGIYNNEQEAEFLFGTAPENLPASAGKYNSILLSGSKRIVIVRPPPNGAGLIRQMPQNMQRRVQPPAMIKYQTGVYLEYSNSSYISERRLMILVIVLFVLCFGAAAVLVYRLDRSNRILLVKTEQDKQLIQLGEAARTLAHEIRNPLGALKIQRDLLERKLPDGFESNLKVIDRELKRLNTLVEKVGEFLRNPVGRPERIDLGEFAAGLYGGREDVYLKHDGAAEILFDRERLRTVLDNLVNNAVESGGRAQVFIGGSRRGVLLDVRDSGSGFSSDSLQRLFDPFFTTKNNGTGLGLAVVKRLVESAGGMIEAENLKEGGASVKVYFGEGHESSDS